MSPSLDHLLRGIAPAPALTLGGLVLDSRKVRPGDAFVALAGQRGHGLQHAAQACQRGAAAVLFEPPPPPGIVLPDKAIPVPGLRAHLGELADRCFEAPSQALRVIGVTGTNGKTSCVQLLVQLLEAMGRRTGSIGTLGSGLHGALRAGTHTTPDVLAVHAELARMRAAGAEDVAMEVSSHALDQGRVDAVRFRVAAFTNLSRDHLDYHADMAAYGAAKARLFTAPTLETAVIHLDDAFGAALAASLQGRQRVLGVSSRGAAGASLQARNPQLLAEGLAFELVEAEEVAPVRSRLLGRFNIDNLLIVAGVARALGWPLARIAAALEQLAPVPGRMNRLGGGASQPLVVVDYAHTPDALEQALHSLRAHTAGRLYCVFGCGGERDAGKRPQMAAVAERLADVVILTDDNPRGEDGDAIVADMLAGLVDRAGARVQRDRARAIAQAITAAQPGDTVLIAGKGHEPYQEIAGVRQAFDDARVALDVLEGRA